MKRNEDEKGIRKGNARNEEKTTRRIRKRTTKKKYNAEPDDCDNCISVTTPEAKMKYARISSTSSQRRTQGKHTALRFNCA